MKNVLLAEDNWDLSKGTCTPKKPKRKTSASVDWWMDWIGERDKEISAYMYGRAVELCRSCPVLEECSERLKYYETKDTPIEGVVAGRTWVSPYRIKAHVNCEVCGIALLMKKIYDKLEPYEKEYCRPHYALSMCPACYRRTRRHESKERHC